jgi:hypothetical protein
LVGGKTLGWSIDTEPDIAKLGEGVFDVGVLVPLNTREIGILMSDNNGR